MTEISQYLSQIGSKGGKTTASKMTPEQRSARAKKAYQSTKRYKDLCSAKKKSSQ